MPIRTDKWILRQENEHVPFCKMQTKITIEYSEWTRFDEAIKKMTKSVPMHAEVQRDFERSIENKLSIDGKCSFGENVF